MEFGLKQAWFIKPAGKRDANLSAKQVLFSLYRPISNAKRPKRTAQKLRSFPEATSSMPVKHQTKQN